MAYSKTINNGYIVTICENVNPGNITEAEYNEIMAVIQNRPTPPEGYDYRLKEDLTWELYEVPYVPVEEDATEQDLVDALAELGVKDEESNA